MPWFPDFVSAAEMARREARLSGHADPVAEYLKALEQGRSHQLEEIWPGQVVIEDPRAGELEGHAALRRFFHRNRIWLAERNARTVQVAQIHAGPRAVLELLAHLEVDGRDTAWPIAVVAESADDRSVSFRTYCSTWPVDGHRQVRPAILGLGRRPAPDVVGRYQLALAAGDVEGVVETFAPNGYVREPFGPDGVHQGTEEIRAFFSDCFRGGGGIELEACEATDDGERCALEYNLVRWGSRRGTPQAGAAVFERTPDGSLAAVRIYDDVESPVAAPS